MKKTPPQMLLYAMISLIGRGVPLEDLSEIGEDVLKIKKEYYSMFELKNYGGHSLRLIKSRSDRPFLMHCKWSLY